jgi:hypothetical protein
MTQDLVIQATDLRPPNGIAVKNTEELLCSTTRPATGSIPAIAVARRSWLARRDH